MPAIHQIANALASNLKPQASSNNCPIQLPHPDPMKLQPRQVLIDPRPLGGDEVVHRTHINLTSGFDETGNRLTFGQDTVGDVLHIDRGGNLVQTGFEVAVRHVIQTVAHVHQDLGGVFVWQGDESVRVGAVAVLHFETAGVVLEEEGDHAEVGVRPGATVLARAQLLRGDRGVVIHAEFVDDGR